MPRRTASSSLREYHEKRDFTRTAEPRGQRKRGGGDLFVVHKHAARRLHYDLRLELDGVLKSWAVTRGPSLSPEDKRLAVRTEDHPLDYGEFEGRIPEGEYGAGSVIVWDRGRWSTDGDPHEQLAKGHLVVDLNGRKLKGRWHLVHMKGRDLRGKENWLLIKAEDEFAIHAGGDRLLERQPRSVKTGRTVEDVGKGKVKIWRKHGPPSPSARSASPHAPPARGESRGEGQPHAASLEPRTAPHPDPVPASEARGQVASGQSRPDRIKGAKPGPLPGVIEPQLASPTANPPAGAGWVHEVKFDGYRLMARIDRGRVKLLTRKGLDWTDKFATLKRALEGMAVVTALLDGEVVVETESGAPSFADLQADLSAGRSDRFRYYLFDLIHLDGMDLTGAPLLERKAALASLLAGHNGTLTYSEHFEGRGATVFEHACRLGLEGIVSKLKTGTYRAGRAKSWLKTKCSLTHELAVIGYLNSTTQRRAIGSLVLAAAERKGNLRYAGRVGSGYSSAVAEDLWRRLEPLRIAAPPLAQPPPADVRRNVRWVKPALVAEVEFRGWTADGIVRHAVFKGLRPEKDTADVVRPKPAAKSKGAPTLPVALTHPDRVLWPSAGVTKEGLAEFYAEIWPWIAPHVVNRPLALVRCPGGVDETCFFQKHAWAGISEHVKRSHDPADGEEILTIDGVEGLLSLVQSSVLELHVWGATLTNIEKPDGITFDLDPAPDVEWSDVVSAALEVRDRLKQAGLESFVKTTGGKGLHVYAPLKPHADWAAVKDFAHKLARAMAADSPAKYLAMASKEARRGRIFVDYLRNGRGATAVAAYSTRARAEATVSAPLAWDELGPEMRSGRFTVGNLLNRLSHLADPWRDLRKKARRLPGQ
ncbi:MAG: DNA ligase D [Hyphomicrobiaceae bacterium]|nr:DNA ligase D [Hyphomicrobiaceae bacterium]